MSFTFPPGLARATAQSATGSVEALTRGISGYVASALRRGAGPLQLTAEALAWWNEVSRREAPPWASDHRIIAEWPVARLRDFSADDADSGVATLFLPPQAGHASSIVDYAPGQSQVQTAKEAGLTRVLSLDWRGATRDTKDAGITDYVSAIRESVRLAGGVVNLIGDCQGGWLAVIYAALYPETVNTLTIGGAPVDFHAGEPVIHDWMRVLAPARDLAFYRRLVGAHDGVMPGRYMLAGFITMQPHAELDRQLQLLINIDQPGHVQRYRTFETWFKHTQPIPGAFYLWIVEHLFQNNELIEGRLQVGDRHVALSDITCPLYLLAGASDHITPPDQVFALADHAGTPAEEVSARLVPGGHLGLFMGRETLRDHWAPLLEAIAQRSTP